ncbi:MAG TPA: hypothetical protein PKH07_15890, partial [bacterium]|nr:hypothetical protein [bacterium]
SSRSPTPFALFERTFKKPCGLLRDEFTLFCDAGILPAWRLLIVLHFLNGEIESHFSKSAHRIRRCLTECS